MMDLRREYWAVGLLLLLTSLMYLPIRRAGFVYDDRWYVTNNPGIRRLDFRRIFNDPDTGAAPESGLTLDVYRPVVTGSLALDYHLWGLSPRGFHVENVFLHLINGLLVWLLFRRLFPQSDVSLLATAVFLWHPVQVQSVAFISQRTTLLSATGMLVSLLLLIPPGPWSRLRLCGGWLAFGLALFSRETAGGVILALGLLDVLYAGYRENEMPIRKMPGQWARYAGLSLLTLAYILIRTRLLPAWSELDGPRMWRSDAAIGVMAFAMYVGKLLYPIHLRFHYAYPSPDAWRIIGAVVIAGFYAAVSTGLFFRRDRLATGLAWIFIFLIPVLQFIPSRVFVSERYLYFSVIGLAWVLGEIYSRSSFFRPVLWCGLFLYAFLGIRQIAVWQTEESLWAASVKEDPQDSFAQAAYAGVVNDPGISEAHYRMALMGDATDAVRLSAYINLSRFALQKRHFRGAEIFAEDALRLEPQEPHALYNLMLARQGLH